MSALHFLEINCLFISTIFWENLDTVASKTAGLKGWTQNVYHQQLYLVKSCTDVNVLTSNLTD